MVITATQLKQQTYLVDNVKKEDIIVTKRDRPFAVLVDIERYEMLIDNQSKKENLLDMKHIFTDVQGIIASNVDPVAWQNKLREENDRDVYKDLEF